MEILSESQRIYYGGDMANQDGLGTISRVETSKWGTDYTINMEDGRKLNVSHCVFSPEYLGHGGTRFVTEKAYQDYREKKIQEFKDWSARQGRV